MLNAGQLIQSGGILLVGLIVFAESGLLVGFFLPGDTLLFTAGFFASQHKLVLGWLLLVVIGSTIAGDNVGYSIGKQAGKRLFRKKDGLLFRHKYVEQAEKFYDKHGGKTVIFARFLPVVRTFAPMVAGAGKMPRKRFVFFDVIGSLLWGVGITLLGFWLGKSIPSIDKYLLPVILLAMALSFGPTVYHIIKEPEIRRRLGQTIKKALKKTG